MIKRSSSKLKIVFFEHPGFFEPRSMRRFAQMLSDGMAKRGHSVVSWSPTARFSLWAIHRKLRKWLGYIDQYLVFPFEVKSRLRGLANDTIFVFTDHALGPWVSLVSNHPHAIHCHDFLAQHSAMGAVPEHATGFTGRKYQGFIRRGFSKGKNFISVSNKTKEDLHTFLSDAPSVSEVVYNGVNKTFLLKNHTKKTRFLAEHIQADVSNGYILHVGGNTWYKNRAGVLEIYNAWRLMSQSTIPLILIGDQPSDELLVTKSHSPFHRDISFVTGVDDNFLRLAYEKASVFLFPSFDEGFGWPIAEAMALGCPVIATNVPPMTEVLGDAGFKIPRRPNNEPASEWANECARVVDYVLSLPESERKIEIEKGLNNAKRFDAENALDQIEAIYQHILDSYAPALEKKHVNDSATNSVLKSRIGY